MTKTRRGKKEGLEGIFTVLMTGLTRTGGVDKESIRFSVDHLIEGGVHGLATLGSSSECHYLSMVERKRILDIVIDRTNGRAPIMAGTGCIGTDETIRFSRYAKDAGAGYLLINLPTFLPILEDDIYRHFAKVAKKVEMPIILYNLPSASMDLTPERVVRLSEIENVVGIKEAMAETAPIKKVLELVDKPFSVFTGFSSNLLEVLKMGGAGVIDQMSNLDPKTFVALYGACKKGRIEEAQVMQEKIQSYWSLTKHGGIAWIAATKEVMRSMGQPIRPLVRSPLPQLSTEQAMMIREELKTRGLLKQRLRQEEQ
ncbi:MAG TPA: dihydrodipicolinate synthase family protein [Candidatus Bathyarchaeia archaeon]|nr:dihydrodipicolinate synthase family protein [Candidatus Bathyarchaeia archaeon]